MIINNRFAVQIQASPVGGRAHDAPNGTHGTREKGDAEGAVPYEWIDTSDPGTGDGGACVLVL